MMHGKSLYHNNVRNLRIQFVNRINVKNSRIYLPDVSKELIRELTDLILIKSQKYDMKYELHVVCIYKIHVTKTCYTSSH